ncbi:phage minor capsid protein [Amycolatopsis sp. cmx-4-54]|uniref:phage minor capsid protein n=1 Tax=Amycolatopsis sp. cmx-4-54 TaxID=2790936 RepID=UPI00397D513F
MTSPAAAPLGANPASGAATLKTLLDVWDLAAERMIIAVARRLARGITTDGWAERKARETLALRDELRAIMARLDITSPRLVEQALADAYLIGQRAGKNLEGFAPLASRPELVQTLARRYVEQLHGTHVPIVRAHEDVYRRATTETELLMQTGTMVRRDAVAQIVDRLLVSGHDRFPDSAGRRWHLDAYARMAGRTIAGQAVVQGQLDEMVAEGSDVVVISDSPRECKLCRPWEGRLLSITGRSVGQDLDGHRVVGTVAEARLGGLWHPNCTHRADPVIPGLTRIRPAKSDPEGYKQTQKLRALERNSRELKRREAAARELGDTPTARKLRAEVRENSAAIEAHAAASGLKRRTDRERGPIPASTRRAPASRPGPEQPPRPNRDDVPTVARMEIGRDEAARAAREHVERVTPEPVDLATLSDADLDDYLTRVSQTDDFDALEAAIVEMERREAAPVDAAPVDAKQQAADEREQRQWEHFERLIDAGWDEESAAAEAYGRSVEQQHRDRAIESLRARGYTGRGFDELARAAFRDVVYDQYLAAEDETRGHMLNAAGTAAGIDPLSLFTGNAARARKYASDELKQWWDNHGRITYDAYIADLLGDTEAARDARFRTGGEDWLR